MGRRVADRLRGVARAVLATAMIVVGVAHFARPGPFVKIVPGYLPRPRELVYLSGFFEVLGGVGLLVPRWSRAAAWGLIALFVAVFPANVNMAVNRIEIEGVPNDPLLYWARLPLQGVLIAWAWWLTRPEPATA
jgi:uncharacterized membrane protein